MNSSVHAQRWISTPPNPDEQDPKRGFVIVRDDASAAIKTALIGESERMRTLIRQVRLVSPTDSTVLILGETGTGKGRVANLIHKLSGRGPHAFVQVNCAAIPLGLLESELFGHERGAFTGAVAQRIGRFELADGGSLFLDEIGDIPLELQPKLLRVLQEQEFERLGSTRTIRTNVRLIAATHRNLRQMVTEGKFREDLFYRFNVFPLTVPPLRERRDDIPLLASHFVSEFSRQMDRHVNSTPPELMDRMARHSWPGNIRELENFIERAVILSHGEELNALAGELPTCSAEPVSDEPLTLKDAQRAHISRTLRETNGIIGAAAHRLGIPRSTLFYKMRRLGITARPQHV